MSPEVPEVTALTQSTDSSVSGLSSDIDARTQDQDVVISGCTQDQIDIYEIDETAQHLATSLNIDTNGTCTWTPEGGTEQIGGNPYTISIPAANTSSNKTETSNIITVRAKDDAQNTSLSNKFTFYLDSGVVNFSDDVTISNSGSDYYIQAVDENSTIDYVVTDDSCDSSLTYTSGGAYDPTTGVSSLVLGVEKQICFKVVDSNTTPNTEYYSSNSSQASGVFASLDFDSDSGTKGDSITNNTIPTFSVTNVEGNNSVVLLSTWDDDDDTYGNSDGLVQASELIVRGVAQNTGSSAGDIDVAWGASVAGYTPPLTFAGVNSGNLISGDHYFTANIVDYVGNTSVYTPLTKINISTTNPTVSSIELTTNTYPSQFGSSELQDNITKESDLQLAVCASSESTLTLQDASSISINSTVVEDTADTTCQLAKDSKYTIDITSGTLQASPSGETHNLHIDLVDSTNNSTDGLTDTNAQISITVDSGIVNFGNIATIYNAGTDYYIKAVDENSTIDYVVTDDNKAAFAL